MKLSITTLPYDFAILKVRSYQDINLDNPFTFTGSTDQEKSLVCRLEDCPEEYLEKDVSWKGFRIDGVLDFSLIGILSEIATVLKNAEIGIFAVSTYNTDYVFVKKENFSKALKALQEHGISLQNL